jgi:predicted regulator of Ras-like GTPase activity (Roadblock/LC7/MglB family)
MDASAALTEMMQLSSQVRRAVVLDASGEVLAAAPPGSAGSDALPRAAVELLDAGGALRTGSLAARVEVSLPEGAVVVVREGELVAAAATAPDPVASLVVYDLRTCLRRVGGDGESDA